MKTFFRAVLIAMILLSASPLRSQTSASTPDSTRKICINILRVINTAENDYFGANKHYATLQELVSSGAMAKARQRFTKMLQPTELTDIKGEEVDGVHVQLMLDQNASHYVIFAKPANGTEQAFVTETSGLIYTASALQ